VHGATVLLVGEITGSGPFYLHSASSAMSLHPCVTDTEDNAIAMVLAVASAIHGWAHTNEVFVSGRQWKEAGSLMPR
jgi:hypothetical protein